MRLVCLLGVVLLALGVIAPTPAFADNVEGKIVKTEGEGHEKLDPFKGAVDLSIFTILVFLILFSLLRAFAWKPITEGLAKREEAMARDKMEAVKARQEADALRAQLQAEMAKVNDQIRSMMDKARQDASAVAAEELARGKKELAEERERLQRELRISTDDALQKIWQQSAQLATLISSKAVRKQLSEQDHRALVDEALAEFRQALEGRKEQIESARA